MGNVSSLYVFSPELVNDPLVHTLCNFIYKFEVRNALLTTYVVYFAWKLKEYEEYHVRHVNGRTPVAFGNFAVVTVYCKFLVVEKLFQGDCRKSRLLRPRAENVT